MPKKPKKVSPSFKIWLEINGKPLIGKGGIRILQAIEKEGSISKAAKSLGMSYRYVWGYLTKMEDVFGEPVVKTRVGGVEGGGAKLTKTGRWLVNEYLKLESLVEKALKRLK